MQLEKSSRKQTKIKISLAGSSGSGKSFSAILLGYGLCNDFSKMCIIDTENYSASFYSHLGDFNVINLTAPFHPSKYVEAIQLCEQSGIEVVIIDNASHAWSGKGGCLELQVWPPSVGSRASTGVPLAFSYARIFSTVSGVIGSI